MNIGHRLTKPRTLKTNGMGERFNGRIADVLKTHLFISGEDLEQTLTRYVALYNHQLPQAALKSKTPMSAMKDWCATHPHLFIKRPYDRPGCDIYLSNSGGLKNLLILVLRCVKSLKSIKLQISTTNEKYNKIYTGDKCCHITFCLWWWH